MTLKLSLRYLRRRKMRTILTTLSIVFGVMIIFGMNGLIPAIEASFNESMTASVHTMDLILFNESGIVFDQNRINEIRELEGIKIVSPILEENLYIGDEYGFKTIDDTIIDKIVINGIDPTTAKATLPLSLEDGRWLDKNDKNKVLVRETFVKKTGLNIGNSINLPTDKGIEAFEIIGVFPQKPTIGDEEIFMSLTDAQRVFNLEGKINAIVGNFHDGVDEERLRDDIETIFGEGYVVGSIDAGASEWESIYKMGNVIFTLFGIVALAMGGFIMYNSFKVSVSERKRDIGMLRTLGASKKHIKQIVVYEGLIQGIIGTLIGLIFGYLLLSIILPIIRPIWKDFFNVELGSPIFTFPIYMMALALGIGIPVISVLGPARKATNIQPMDALKPQMSTLINTSYKKRVYFAMAMLILAIITIFVPNPYVRFLGALLALSALIVFSPVLVNPIVNIFIGLVGKGYKSELIIASRNVKRLPKRSANTSTSMLISIALIISIAGLATTFTFGLMGYLEKSMKSDYLLLPEALVLGSEGNIGAGEDLNKAILSVDGIKELTALRYSKTQSNGLTLGIIGVEPQSYSKLSGLTFQKGDEKTAYDKLNNGKKIIINAMLATQGGYDIGDRITINTANGKAQYDIVAIGIDYLNSKAPTAYISHKNIEEDFNIHNYVMYMINRTENSDPKKVEESLVEITKSYPSFSVMSYDVWKEYQKQGNQTRNFFMYFIVMLLALPSLIALANTLGMNIIERTREIGLLRAIGMTKQQIRKMIMAESLVISLMGVALGIISGIWLSLVFVELMNVSGFVLHYYFPVTGLVVGLITGVLFGILAAILPIKRATNLDIVESIAFE